MRSEARRFDEYGCPSSVSEAELIGAYFPRLLARPCACGEVIVADVIDPGPYLRAHYATPAHQAYREPRRSTAVESPRDLSGSTDGASTAGGSRD